MESNGRKRLVDEGRDRISSLPESVLLHIRSLLPMKQAIRTSVLSKTWQFIWTSVPSLALSSSCSGANFSPIHFAQSVDKILMQHCTREIQKFSISIPFEECLQQRVDSWVQFAIRRQVEELHLDFCGYDSTGKYVLPLSLYKHQTLTKIRTKECIFQPSGSVCLPSLKSLRIKHSEVSGDIITSMVAGCPTLELLELKNCEGIQNLKIRSESLKEFRFEEYAFRPSMYDFELWVPNLPSLSLHSGWQYRKHKLVDMSSLVEVKLYFSYGRHLQGSRLDFLKIRMEELLRQLHKLEKLTLEARSLEKKCIAKDPGSKMKSFWRQKKAFTCLQLTLKRVDIVGFQPNREGWEFVNSLAEFLLNNALVLEKMVFCTQKDDGYQPWNRVGSEELWKLLEATRQIYGYKKASPTAEVLLESYIK